MRAPIHAGLAMNILVLPPTEQLRRRLLLPMLVAVLFPAVAQGQEEVTVSGEVRDAETSAPVVGAVVAISELRLSATTDSLGSFVIARVPPGAYEWTVVGLGYERLIHHEEVREGVPLLLELAPRPIELTGVVATVDRIDELLRQRRNAAGMSVRLLTREEILTQGTARADQMVMYTARMVVCPNVERMDLNPVAGIFSETLRDAATGLRECIRSRGGLVPTAVYIDENLIIGGMMQLGGIEPSDLYAVEIRGNGLEVRVFTNAFIEKVATGEATLRRDPLPASGIRPGG